MAKQRYINTKFWSDSFIRDNLNPLDRYLFIYFLTNEKTNIAGIYELPLSIISFETGIEKENLLKMMERLKPKIYYFEGWVYIANFQKHQKTGSERIDKGIANEMQLVPKKIIGYIEGIDRVCIGFELFNTNTNTNTNINLNEIKNKINIPFTSFRDLYNYKVGDKRKAEIIRNRLKDEEREKIIKTIPDFIKFKPFDSYQRPYPSVYLNGKRRNDEIPRDKKKLFIC